MKRVRKSTFFIVSSIMLAISCISFCGISEMHGDIKKIYIKGANEIRWGIDIQGGVDVTFKPEVSVKPTAENMRTAEATIKQRLLDQNITDSEVYVDTNKGRVIVRFPWKQDEKDFDPASAIEELAATANLTFREGVQRLDGKPTGETLTNVVINGSDIKKAEARVNEQNAYVVNLELFENGAKKFAKTTEKLSKTHGQISIWMDDEMISAPLVQNTISNGIACITGMKNAYEANTLASKINSGALPFKLETDNFNVINPTLGIGARNAMLLTGVITFLFVALFMIFNYKLCGVIYVLTLIGQVSFAVAAITGFFPFVPSFTLTLPGIAGIILSIGMGVDAGIIISERIKEEIKNGRTVRGAVNSGYNKGITAVLDGNTTVLIVAAVLMGAFGPTSGFFAKILLIFKLFGPSTVGTIYSFGYTLIIGSILNILIGILTAKLMMKSLTSFKIFYKPILYGGVKDVK